MFSLVPPLHCETGVLDLHTRLEDGNNGIINVILRVQDNHVCNPPATKALEKGYELYRTNDINTCNNRKGKTEMEAIAIGFNMILLHPFCTRIGLREHLQKKTLPMLKPCLP